MPGAAARTETAGRAGKADRTALGALWAVQEVMEDVRVEAHFGPLLGDAWSGSGSTSCGMWTSKVVRATKESSVEAQGPGRTARKASE